jgi:hypothetical protein
MVVPEAIMTRMSTVKMDMAVTKAVETMARKKIVKQNAK